MTQNNRGTTDPADADRIDWLDYQLRQLLKNSTTRGNNDRCSTLSPLYRPHIRRSYRHSRNRDRPAGIRAAPPKLKTMRTLIRRNKTKGNDQMIKRILNLFSKKRKAIEPTRKIESVSWRPTEDIADTMALNEWISPRAQTCDCTACREGCDGLFYGIDD